MPSTHTQGPPCRQCQELREEIRQLRAALDGAVYHLNAEGVAVQSALPLSPQQALVVVVLWRARRTFLTWELVSESLPNVRPHRSQMRNLVPRQDPDFRCKSMGTSVVRQIRLRVGQDFLETKVGAGYRLSAAAQRRVTRIIEEAQDACS